MTVRRYLTGLRESFWFIPGGMVLLALVAAQALIGLDRWLGAGSSTVLPDSLLIGVDGSRGMLTTLAAAILGVAGTTFSITISVIATASSSYGPRLVRNFIADRSNQLVLGTFVATFVYCLMVLRSIHAGDSTLTRDSEGFVPYVSVYVAIVLALINVAALVYFLHHIADSIQISNLVDRVRRELLSTAKALYGDDIPDSATPAASVSGPTTAILASRTGFLVSIPGEAVVARASEAGAIVGFSVAVGAHVIPGEVIGWTTDPDPDFAEMVEALLTVDDARTPKDDIHFAVQQVIEIAVRALSPGTNDPYTARNVLAELGGGMSIVAAAPHPPCGRTDSDGNLRLVLTIPKAVELVDAIFDDLRTHASGQPQVIRDSLILAQRIVRAAGDSEVSDRTRQQVELLVGAFAASGGDDFDVRRLREWVAETEGLSRSET